MTVAASALPHAAEPSEGWSSCVGVRAQSAWWVLIAGVAGMFVSAALTVEEIRHLSDAGYVPSCSINPVLSCGSAMATPQASVFGLPNSLIGIAAFSVVAATGVLAGGRVRLPRWYWAGLTIGVLAGVSFLHWLIYQSLYVIGALCPYCMVVWVVTIPLLVVLAPIAAPPRGAAGQLAYRWRWSVVALWFTAVALLILLRFWSYWSTLL